MYVVTGDLIFCSQKDYVCHDCSVAIKTGDHSGMIGYGYCAKVHKSCRYCLRCYKHIMGNQKPAALKKQLKKFQERFDKEVIGNAPSLSELPLFSQPNGLEPAIGDR